MVVVVEVVDVEVVVVGVPHERMSVVRVPLRFRLPPAGTRILTVNFAGTLVLKQSATWVVSAVRCSVRVSCTVLVFALIRSTAMSWPLAPKSVVTTSKPKQTLLPLHDAKRLEIVALGDVTAWTGPADNATAARKVAAPKNMRRSLMFPSRYSAIAGRLRRTLCQSAPNCSDTGVKLSSDKLSPARTASATRRPSSAGLPPSRQVEHRRHLACQHDGGGAVLRHVAARQQS